MPLEDSEPRQPGVEGGESSLGDERLRHRRQTEDATLASERTRRAVGGGTGPARLLPAPALSAQFTHELEAARRRVAVLEEANRAIQDSMDRLSRLSRFSEGLDRSGSVDDVVELLFEEIRGILPLKEMLFALLDCVGQEFHLSRVVPEECASLAHQEFDAQVSSGMFGWAIGLRRPTMVTAVHLGTNLVLVPLATARRTVGMLMIGTPLGPDAVEQQHLTLAGVVARQAAECIDNLWMAEDIRRQHETRRLAAEEAAARRVADLGLLVESADALTGSAERDAALRFLVEATCRHLDVSTVTISILESNGGLSTAYSAGLSSACLGNHPCGVGQGCPLGRVADRREPLMIQRVHDDPRAQDCVLLRASGVVSLLGVPLVARDRAIGVLSVMTDVPREFTAEEIALLKGLAAQGAGAIENARLIADVQGRMEQQQRALARLVQSAHLASVGLLAGGVAHDINNPLCIISNHLQLLRLRPERVPVEIEGALSAIGASVRRIAGSVEALLDYARVRPGERQATDLNEALRRILVLLRYHPVCRRLTVATDLGAGLPLVDLDRAAWDQVMLELITNAREAMTAGGRVRIATRRLPPSATETGSSDPDGGAPAGAEAWVEVVVEDEGPGIAPDELARLFDPFFTTKPDKRGMGIGLKICRDIVLEHGGRFRVESEGGSGTRVVIEVPASRGGDRDENLVGREEGAAQASLPIDNG